MTIEINGQPLAFSLENEKTTGDILNALEAHHILTIVFSAKTFKTCPKDTNFF